MADVEFEIKIKTYGQFKVVGVTGDLNMFNAKIFKTHCEQIIEEGTRIAIDLEHMDYIDSSGMGALITLQKALKASGRNLILIHPNDRVRNTFQLVKIDKVFKIIETVDDL